MYEIIHRYPKGPELGSLSSIFDDVKNLVAGVVGAAFHGTQVQVPLPGGGTATYDISNPASLAALRATLAGIRVTRAPAAPTGAPRSPGLVDSIPGGWLTLGAILIGAVVVMKKR